jgi:hypothetical protein
MKMEVSPKGGKKGKTWTPKLTRKAEKWEMNA